MAMHANGTTSVAPESHPLGEGTPLVAFLEADLLQAIAHARSTSAPLTDVVERSILARRVGTTPVELIDLAIDTLEKHARALGPHPSAADLRARLVRLKQLRRDAVNLRQAAQRVDDEALRLGAGLSDEARSVLRESMWASKKPEGGDIADDVARMRQMLAGSHHRAVEERRAVAAAKRAAVEKLKAERLRKKTAAAEAKALAAAKKLAKLEGESKSGAVNPG